MLLDRGSRCIGPSLHGTVPRAPLQHLDKLRVKTGASVADGATQREAVAARYVLNPLKHYTNCVAHLQANLPPLIYIRLRPSAQDPHDVAARVEKRVHRVEAPLEVVLRLERMHGAASVRFW